MASSMMTYMAIVQFLPEYYSMELRTELDRMSGDMVKNISAYSASAKAKIEELGGKAEVI